MVGNTLRTPPSCYLPAGGVSCRRSLLSVCKALIYTPQNEHFGIVPLEAMARGRPVIACASGGPKETVAHLQTGFLSDPTALGFANAIVRVLTMVPPDLRAMQAAARERMREYFARPAFAAAWQRVLHGDRDDRRSDSSGANPTPTGIGGGQAR